MPNFQDTQKAAKIGEFEQKVAKVTKGIRVGLEEDGVTRQIFCSALDVQRTTKGECRLLSTSERRQRNTQKKF
jgi:hypothetical protein